MIIRPYGTASRFKPLGNPTVLRSKIMNRNLLIKFFTEWVEIHKKCIFAAQSTTKKVLWLTKLVKIFAPLAEPASANALKRLSLKALLTLSTLISASNAVHAQTFVLAKLSA